jgi:hypothetical protein
MKNLSALIYSVIVLIAVTACRKDEVKPGENLPSEIKSYISTNFAEQLIIEAKINANDTIKAFEITLDNLTDLEFNNKYEITDIDGITKLPDSVISVKIRDYVTLNYPDKFITGWELDEGKQEVELNDSMDLEFDMNNNFLQIDITP